MRLQHGDKFGENAWVSTLSAGRAGATAPEPRRGAVILNQGKFFRMRDTTSYFMKPLAAILDWA